MVEEVTIYFNLFPPHLQRSAFHLFPPSRHAKKVLLPHRLQYMPPLCTPVVLVVLPPPSDLFVVTFFGLVKRPVQTLSSRFFLSDRLLVSQQFNFFSPKEIGPSPSFW